MDAHIPKSGIVALATIDTIVLRLKRTGKALIAIEDTINNMYDRALFPEKLKRILLFFAHSQETNLVPYCGRISKHKELSVSLFLDSTIIAWADKYNFELLKEIYMIAACESVLYALRKYKLPTERVEAERAKYGTIPATVEECERIYGREE
ncbi:MAG: immunity protein 39 [Proteobacteria bacterium]|nr:immunity protein 39 [Pseudomonadota bacterium]